MSRDLNKGYIPYIIILTVNDKRHFAVIDRLSFDLMWHDLRQRKKNIIIYCELIYVSRDYHNHLWFDLRQRRNTLTLCELLYVSRDYCIDLLWHDLRQRSYSWLCFCHIVYYLQVEGYYLTFLQCRGHWYYIRWVSQ